MRLKKIELIIIALTLALTCFLSGYFVGRRSAVNIVTVAPRAETQTPGAGQPSETRDETRPSGAIHEDNTANGGDGAVNQPSDRVEQGVEPGENDQTQPSEVIGAPRGGDGRININTASRGELMDLPGIGPSLAERIIDHRNQNGSFSNIEDIMNVSGIAEGRFSRIKDMITVG